MKDFIMSIVEKFISKKMIIAYVGAAVIATASFFLKEPVKEIVCDPKGPTVDVSKVFQGPQPSPVGTPK